VISDEDSTEEKEASADNLTKQKEQLLKDLRGYQNLVATSTTV
jgi:hypothetical protein